MKYMIQAEDVGARTLKIGGQTQLLSESLGVIRQGDVGKIITINRRGELSCETDEQRAAREAKEQSNVVAEPTYRTVA